MNTHRPPLHSQAKAVTRKREEERHNRFKRLLAISIMCALTLSAIFLARAETWATVNEDGSVTRTEVRPQPQTATPSVTGNYAAVKVPGASPADIMRAYDNAIAVAPNAPSFGYQTPNTTFFSGTYYPVPGYTYSYPTPGGVTYPVGPVLPNVPSPTITTLPGTATYSAYGYPYPAYPAYGYPATPYYPAPAYPYPVYSYPAYGSTGVFYSGPMGGGGTVYSSTTTTGSGLGLSYGKNGWRFNLGNKNSSTRSSTTVTTGR